MSAATITFIFLLAIGVWMVLRSKADVKVNRTLLVLGLVLIGIGGFGILNLWLDGWTAFVVTTVIIVGVPAVITKPLKGVIYGLIAVLIILVIAVIFSIIPVGELLVEAITAITESATAYGEPVIDLIPMSEWIDNLPW